MGEIDKGFPEYYDNGKVNTRTLNDKGKKVMRCAVYVRVSTDKDTQKESLVTQKEMAFNYIRDKGWTFHDIYTDIESGTRAKRPQLQKLLQDAKENKFDVILTKELSRFARNGALSYQIRDLIEQKGIHLVTMDGLINTIESQMNMYGFLTAIYEEESRSMSRRIKSVFEVKARKGEFLGSNPPLGYKVIDKKLFIQEDETPDIIRRIFREYIEGKGHDAIARGLYEDEVRTPSSYANKKNATIVWHGLTVRTILRNPHYTGDIVQNRTTSISLTSDKRKDICPSQWIVVEDAHDAIISRPDFQLVQRLLIERKRIRPQSKTRLFSNLLFCADCGKGMHFKKNSKGYVCGNFNKHGSKRCSNHRIRKENLIEVLQDEFQRLSKGLKVDNITSKLESRINSEEKKLQKKVPSLENKLSRIKVLKRNAFEMLSEEKINQDDYNDYIESCNEQEKQLQLEIAAFEEISEQQSDIQILDQLRTTFFEILDFKELNADMLHRFIEKIEIKADGSPRIYYRFSDTSALYLLNSNHAQHSTCDECGNISTGCTSCVR